MDLIFLDFETYWSSTHDIKKCGGPIRYVAHPDTEIQSCAIKLNNEETFVVFGDDIAKAFSKLPIENAMLVGHNMSGFDSVICTLRYGLKPKAWGCTMAMARPIFAKTAGVSLKAVAAALGVGTKLSLEATNTKGKRLADFTPQEIDAMRRYNEVDTDLCRDIFYALYPLIGLKELKTIDYTIRMFCQPKFVCDTELLGKTLIEVQNQKAQTLADTASQFGLSSTEEMRSLLASAPKFANILSSLGVEPPTKISKATGKETFALAKTDQGLLDLQEHPDPRVQAIVAARLDVKSTILETRLQSFINNTIRGKIPMPISYAGADTTGRFSGFIFNPQNLPRIGKDPKPSDALRKSLRAPKGYKVVVADQSGIELRVNHFLWKVPSSVALYESDAQADLYKAFAAAMYNKPIDDVDKAERQLAKVAQLGLMYGSGAKTFERIAKLMGGIVITPEEAKETVDAWRKEYVDIVRGWRACDAALPHILSGTNYQIDPWGFCSTTSEGIKLPSGRLIRYPHLRKLLDEDSGKKQFYYGEGRHKASIYAGKITENIIQAVSRDIINDNALQVIKETGYTPSLMVHDELVYIVPESEAEAFLGVLQGFMRASPDWWPEIVLWSEGDIADNYGDAK